MCSPSARRWPPARSGPGGPPRSGRSVCASGQRRTPVSHHWQDCQALGLLTRSTAAQRRASRRWPGRSGSRPGSGRQRWPHSGRTTALNGATCCASLSSIAPVHQPYGLVRDVHVSLYGLEGWGSSPSERATKFPGHELGSGPSSSRSGSHRTAGEQATGAGNDRHRKARRPGQPGPRFSTQWPFAYRGTLWSFA